MATIGRRGGNPQWGTDTSDGERHQSLAVPRRTLLSFMWQLKTQWRCCFSNSGMEDVLLPPPNRHEAKFDGFGHFKSRSTGQQNVCMRAERLSKVFCRSTAQHQRDGTNRSRGGSGTLGKKGQKNKKQKQAKWTRSM